MNFSLSRYINLSHIIILVLVIVNIKKHSFCEHQPLLKRLITFHFNSKKNVSYAYYINISVNMCKNEYRYLISPINCFSIIFIIENYRVEKGNIIPLIYTYICTYKYINKYIYIYIYI
jgi:hypothetical protein